MSKASKKQAEYVATIEANLSRLYQNYLDRVNEKTGRQITKEHMNDPEKETDLRKNGRLAT